MKITKSLKLALRKLLEVELGEIKADNATLIFEGELAVGIEVFVQGEGDELAPAADGEYLAEDGRKIIVKEGLISEIVEAEKNEEEPVAEPEVKENKEENLEEISEPAAEPAEPEATESGASAEERIAALEARNEEIVAGIEKILNSFIALEERIAAIEEKVKGLEEPAAEPAAEPEVEEEKQSKISYLRKQK